MSQYIAYPVSLPPSYFRGVLSFTRVLAKHALHTYEIRTLLKESKIQDSGHSIEGFQEVEGRKSSEATQPFFQGYRQEFGHGWQKKERFVATFVLPRIHPSYTEEDDVHVA